MLDIYWTPGELSSEPDHECKTVTLCDTVPNKPKYCNWLQGVSLWLIGGCWSDCRVEPISCLISFMQTQIGLQMARCPQIMEKWFASCCFHLLECKSTENVFAGPTYQ
ncbi:hypothetical protein GOODEAATRI_029384 [Goodea atripinnis]|uniref:Uncharacterized protein n=1 Tax=Goodea atripinnis TaxID=208336 RepID=A0ABV0N576_9TELE